MKFLFCGFGNIMQRHFRNLKRLLPDCEISVYTHRHDFYRIFDDELKISHTSNLLEYYAIDNIFFDINPALDSERYDAVFIGTLPPERINVAINAAKKGFNFFVEKPLSNNINRIYELQEIVEIDKLKCAIGFQMRFHPLLQKVKDMLDSNEFGDIYRIKVSHCNSIYNWTKDRDLSNFYALREETGGGVLLSQIHELDYLTWIFGKHYPISAIYGKWLNIPNSDVEDNITILSNLELTNTCIPVIINLDFLSKIPTRKITIYGTEKTETFDLMDKSVLWNDLFLEEMKAFLNLLNDEKQENLATLEDGIHSLEYVMDIKDNMVKIGLGIKRGNLQNEFCDIGWGNWN